MIRNWLFRLGATCVLAAVAVTGARADEIDPLLAKDGAALMKVLRSRGYKNIGVLKFEVQRGGPNGPVSMTNGTLNSMMATRLENALILANNDKNPIGITRNASDVAAKSDKSAGYHTKEAREKLFDLSYPLAWGSDAVKVDAFLTGRVTVSADYKKSTVLVRLFDRKNSKMIDAALFDAPVDRALIVDLGQPFAVSKAVIAKRALLISPNTGNDPGTPTSASAEDMVLEDVQKSAESADKKSKAAKPVDVTLDDPTPAPKVRPNPPPTPTAPPPATPSPNNQRVQMKAVPPTLADVKAELDSVLQFDVYYNGQLVKWTADNRLPTPQPNDTLEFRVRAEERIGMILRVNGVNTADFDRTDKEISDYTKWVLEPNKDYTIAGFYTDDNKCIQFKAVPSEEVESSELGNERRIGKIDLDILREAPTVASRKMILDAQEARRGTALRSAESAENVSELKGKLRQVASRRMVVGSRAPLFVGDNEVDAKVDITSFVGVHAIHMPITYSDPRAASQAPPPPAFLQPDND